MISFTILFTAPFLKTPVSLKRASFFALLILTLRKLCFQKVCLLQICTIYKNIPNIWRNLDDSCCFWYTKLANCTLGTLSEMKDTFWYWTTSNKRHIPSTSRNIVECSVTQWKRTSVAITAWPQIVFRWPTTHDSDWIKISLGLISIPNGNENDSGHPRPCQKSAVVTCPLIIHPKHRNNVSFLSRVGQWKGRFSILLVTTSS